MAPSILPRFLLSAARSTSLTHRNRVCYRPSLEGLEDRTLPTATFGTALAGVAPLGGTDLRSSEFNTAFDPSNYSVTVTSNRLSPVFGEAVTFTVRVISLFGAPPPTGNVTFILDGKSVGTLSLNAQGQAFLTRSNLSVGAHTVQVVSVFGSSVPITQNVLERIVQRVVRPLVGPPGDAPAGELPPDVPVTNPGGRPATTLIQDRSSAPSGDASRVNLIRTSIAVTNTANSVVETAAKSHLKQHSDPLDGLTGPVRFKSSSTLSLSTRQSLENLPGENDSTRTRQQLLQIGRAMFRDMESALEGVLDMATRFAELLGTAAITPPEDESDSEALTPEQVDALFDNPQALAASEQAYEPLVQALGLLGGVALRVSARHRRATPVSLRG